MSIDQHQSVYREQLLEHLLVSQLLRFAWLYDEARLEVMKPEIDRSGYDIVLEANVPVDPNDPFIELLEVDDGARVTFALGPFLFFGGSAGEPMPSLDGMQVARHTRGNAQGHKAERPSIRVLPKGKFTELATINDLYGALFGLAV